MRLTVAFLLLLLSCCFANAATTDKELQLDVPNKQQTFVVTLPANATTGYQWSVVTFDNALLTLDKSNYLAPNTKLIGAGGQMQYTFSLNKGKQYSAQTSMLFKYARAWEPDSAMLKKVTIRFIADSKQ